MSIQRLAELLEEELAARGWTTRGLAVHMCGEEIALAQVVVDLLLACRENPGVLVDTDTALRLDRALGLSTGFCQRVIDSGRLAEDQESPS